MAEVVVIGGGIVGLSISWSLRSRTDLSVVLVEKALCGQGSTAKATGGIRCQFSSRVNVLLTLESLRYFRDWKTIHGSDVGYRPIGYTFLATRAQQMEILSIGASMQRRCGAHVKLLDVSSLADLLPGVELGGVLGGTLCPDDGLADPGMAVSSLVSSCRRMGVTVKEQTEVLRIIVESGRVLGVETSAGSIRADSVIVAAGPSTALLLHGVGFDVPITPRHRQVYHAVDLENLPAACPFVVDLDTGIYFHKDGAGLIFGGGDRDGEIGYDDDFRIEEASETIELLCRRLPQASRARLTGGWAGIRDMTPDDVGIVGQVPGVDHLLLAAGFSGHGFMHAPAIGEEVARMVNGEEPGIDLAPLAPDRFGLTSEKESYAF